MVFTPDLANLLAITTAGFDNLNLNITWYIWQFIIVYW
jgi:hypothetical protein